MPNGFQPNERDALEIMVGNRFLSSYPKEELGAIVRAAKAAGALVGAHLYLNGESKAYVQRKKDKYELNQYNLLMIKQAMREEKD